MNVQGICDAKLKFSSIVAKYPGSAHDAFIWRNCAVYNWLEARDADNNVWLLGDSGYPVSRFLMTPVNNARTVAEQRYNSSHSRTRNTIERAFGLLKMRFRCLHKTGGCLMSPPSGCAEIVMACAVLHNMCINNAIPAPDQIPLDDEGLPEPAEVDVTDSKGASLRRQLIDKRFGQ